VTEKELERVKTQYFSRFIRGSERIGGFGGKSDILASNMTYGGSPDYYKTTLQQISDASVSGIKNTAAKWLSDGVYILEVHPFPEYATTDTGADRTKLPETGEAPDVKFPEIQRTTLSNGLKIVLAERHSIPIVNFNMVFDAGYAADQFTNPGTSKLLMDMLDEGTKTKSSLEISEELSMLGANLNSGSSLDNSSVSLSTLKANLDGSLKIFADVILNPSFPENELSRLKKQLLAAIQREKVTPIQMGLRVFPKLLYGEGHAYGNPLTGSGTESSVEKITKDDLMKFHEDWIVPNNATLIVVGDITLNEVKSKLESLFKDWKSKNTPVKNISSIDDNLKPIVYIMDRPGSQQSLILASSIAPKRSSEDEIAVQTANNILGGQFTSRVNMNLREDKHWSYGASTFIMGTTAQRPFIVYAPVQTDKTKESMFEIKKELTNVLGEKPISMEEF